MPDMIPRVRFPFKKGEKNEKDYTEAKEKSFRS